MCAALGVTTLDDLRFVKVADVEELKTTLKLPPVAIEKLRLLVLQFKTPAASKVFPAKETPEKREHSVQGPKCTARKGRSTRSQRLRQKRPYTNLTAAVAGGAQSGDQLRIKDVALKSKFDECGLGYLCANLCEEWGAESVDDLVDITEEDIDSLPADLQKQLKVVQRNKLKRIIGP